MAQIGKITGRKFDKPINGAVTRIILQVEITADADVRTVDLIAQAGEDTNPANGCRVNIIDITDSYSIGVGVSDDLTPECNPGEKEIYSTDNPCTTKKARLKLDTNGIIILNQGDDYATKYNELKTAFDKLKTDLNNFITVYNAHTHGGVTAGSAATAATATPGTASTADMSTAKSETVMIP